VKKIQSGSVQDYALLLQILLGVGLLLLAFPVSEIREPSFSMQKFQKILTLRIL
jgi:hypothetical protein